ncbi:MAG TPA: hypothetical protein VHK91_02155, partial [Flavisolibacter sp.]|nr:hypothetical protein [Flavisolibacter sp.]
MAKINHLLTAFLVLTLLWGQSYAQGYAIRYQPAAGEDSIVLQQAGLQTQFTSRNEATLYIFKLPALLQGMGFITASMDSLKIDSASARLQLYLGERYKWSHIYTSAQDQSLLEAIHWQEQAFTKTVDFKAWQGWQQKILDYLEENGHPFGKVYLDSLDIREGLVQGRLKIEQGPVYTIDSIRIYGDA